MGNFLALDVETANVDYSSICQIGIVEFKDGIEIDNWTTLVNPNEYFDPFNISIHGISENDVTEAPTFDDVFEKLNLLMQSKIIIHHGHFDRSAFKKSYEKLDLDPISCVWVDSTKIVRRTWEKYTSKGFGLANLAKEFNFEFQHHDALEDARMAGYIVLAALEESGKDIEDWIEHSLTPITKAKSIVRNGNTNTIFSGEKIVFTGGLTMSRAEAADNAQKLGFDVMTTVTNRTTYVCVGTQESARLSGYSKSSKHRKAEALITKGSEITILSEDDFWSLVREYE